MIRKPFFFFKLQDLRFRWWSKHLVTRQLVVSQMKVYRMMPQRKTGSVFLFCSFQEATIHSISINTIITFFIFIIFTNVHCIWFISHKTVTIPKKEKKKEKNVGSPNFICNLTASCIYFLHSNTNRALLLALRKTSWTHSITFCF